MLLYLVLSLLLVAANAGKLRPVPVEIPTEFVISNLHRKYDLSLPAISRINTVIVLRSTSSNVQKAFICIDAQSDDVSLAKIEVLGKTAPKDQVETPLKISKASFDAKKYYISLALFSD